MIGKVMSWLFNRRNKRLKQLLLEPFPEDWRPIVERAVPVLPALNEPQIQTLHDNIRIFNSEKSFRGCAGLEITDEIRITVAAGACLMLLGIPHLDVFPRLREIIMYPRDFTETITAIGPDGRPYEITKTRAGEAWHRGPVVLAWDSVQRSVASPCDGYNLVVHEFAHVIDMQSGDVDGIPPLDTREEYKQWTGVFFREFQQFVDEDRRGQVTFIDPYGASNPAEFFAVASEHFFEQPRQLKRNHPALYDLLSLFYRLDPITWYERSGKTGSRWQPRSDRS